jgi:hypothetical protein
MSDEPKKTLPRIRTFAQDLEHDRQKSGLPLPANIVVPKATAPTPLPTQDNIIKIVDSTVKVSTETPSAQVPAFHELQKKSDDKTATIKVKPLPQKASVAQTPDPVAKTVVVRNTKPTSVGDATIITDTKRTRQGFFYSVIKSFGDWLKSVSTASKQTTTLKYTVVDTERRKGVIQKATTKTGSIFSADNDTLREEIRRRNLEKTEVLDISWSPNTEVGYPLLESGLPTPAKVVVEFKKRSTPESTIIAPIVFEQITETPPAQKPSPTLPPPVFIEPTHLSPQEPEVPTQNETSPAYELTTPEAHYRIKSIGDVTKLNTNLLSIGVVGVIAGIIIVILLGRALLGFILSDNVKVEIMATTPIVATASITDVILDTPTREALIIALQQLPTDEQAQREFRILNKDGTPLPNQALLPLLGFSNAGSLSLSVVEAHIIQIGNTRGIIFTVTDPTTAFGSLLSFEDYMVDNIAPILSISKPAGKIVVTDQTISDTDIRVFSSENQEVLVYGFVSSNSVLVTKDTAAFSAVLGRQ